MATNKLGVDCVFVLVAAGAKGNIGLGHQSWETLHWLSVGILCFYMM